MYSECIYWPPLRLNTVSVRFCVRTPVSFPIPSCCFLQTGSSPPPAVDSAQSVQIKSEVAKPTVNGGVQHSHGAADTENDSDQSKSETASLRRTEEVLRSNL